ncbi:MAG: glycosyltransferase family protein [Cycloclasticus sp.]
MAEERQAQLATINQLLQQERDAHQAREKELSEKIDAEKTALYKSEKEQLRLSQDVKAYQQSLDNTQQEYRQAQERIADLKENLAQELAERKAASNVAEERQAQLEQIHQQQHALKIQLDQANSKYRQATAEQIPALKQQLENKTADVRELQDKLQQLNQQLSVSEDRRRAVEKRLLDLRASLTFKTGYLIREQSRSLIGLLKLPVGLWRLNKQGKKRAQQRLARQAKATKPSVSQNKPASATSSKQAPINNTDFKTPQPLAIDQGATELAHLLLPTQGQTGQKKVACIMDDFTFNCYQPECQLQQLTPSDWQQELEAFQPELLFIESAWRGKDELWGNKVGHQSEELKGIVRWCHEQQVPTVFWNKEDPVHFETFLSTAKLFDHIFTTDIDCLHRYKTALGHERVYLLPFACQPALHNPIEVYQRKDAFSFAGAYYVRYPHRTKDLEGFVENLPGFRPLEIYDRNYGKDNPDYQFPDNYQPYIVGTLPFNEIDKAYKGYRYAINLNSIKQSQSMFARRVFELLASNTLTISNFSRGIRLLFGDLVLATDSGEQVVERLQTLAKTPEDEDKLRLYGLRKVMQEHTYQDRMHYILSKVEGTERQRTLPEFAVFAPVDSEQTLASVIAQVQPQNSVTVTLYPVVAGDLSQAQAQQQLQRAGLKGCALTQQDLAGQTLTDLVADHHWCAAFLPEDYYGPNYLLDIALASRYSQAKVVGKAAYYHYQQDSLDPQNNLALVDAELSYRGVTALPMRASAIHPDIVQRIQATDWLTQLAEGQYKFEAQLAIDRFNYCRNGAEAALSGSKSLVQVRVNDLVLNPGIATDELLATAEQIQPLADNKKTVKRYGPEFLAELVGVSGSKKVAFALSQDGLEVRSELTDGKHEYFYAQRELSRDELFDGLESGDQLPLFFDLEPGLNVSLVALYLDASKQRISHQILRGNANHTLELPLETAFVRLGLRVYAGGQAAIKGVVFAHKDLQPARLLAQSDTLLLTNHYASYSDLYRNGFVHSRVKSYREQGVAVDIFRLRNNEAVSWHEFQGVDVTTGSQEALRRLLASGQYRHVLVHFLDEDMWQVLQEFIDQIKVTVWLHGAEVQPWWRRQFNYQTDEQLALAKLQSEKRIAFWQGLLNPMPENLQLVFVSNYLAQVVMEDLQLELPQSQYHIIHNPINTDLFNYQEKPAEQRKKLLSIRPYASRTYANDLTVEALLELSKESWFDELEICLVGDGPLFDDTLAPLKKFSNITLEKRFLAQDEIAQYHKEYGIFLCPSRMDTQGVSRDEAMASGLVPVTNAVAAIPEFADDRCAILAPEEDAHGMAEGIRTLYKDAQLFLQMSENAAQRVKGNVAQNIIVRNELSVLER